MSMIWVKRKSRVHILFGFLCRQYMPGKESCQEVNFELLAQSSRVPFSQS